MKRLIFLIIGGLIFIGAISSFFILRRQTNESHSTISAAKTERLIIRLSDDRALKKLAKRAKIDRKMFVKKPNSPYYLVDVTPSQKEKILTDRSVALAEVDEPVRIFLTPNDSRFSEQPHWSTVKALNAWDITTGTSSVTVAVIDTGVNGQHEDLNGRVVGGYNYVTSQSIEAGSDSDDHGHGTEVAGVVAATGNNGQGIAGADWKAKIMPVKALDNTGTGSTADAAAAIRYAADKGAKVINLSFGRSTASSVLEDAVNYAWGKGVVMVAAAGNDGAPTVAYPAAYSQVIAVGALNGDTRASFSNYGAELDVVAPGQSILTTKDSANEYITVSGTSLAAPIVAGEVSLIVGYNTSLSNSEVKSRIEGQVDKLSVMGGSSRTDEYGYGRVNFESAVARNYIANYVTQSNYVVGYPGETTSMNVQFRNTGLSSWDRTGTHPMHLAVDKYDESGTRFQSSSWLSDNRIAQMSSETVRSGETASFNFTVTIPQATAPGDYQLSVRLVVEHIEWLEGDLAGAWWRITVPKPTAQYVTQSANPTLRRGQTASLSVTFRNTQGISWKSSGLPATRLAIDKFWASDTAWKDTNTWLSQNRIMAVPQTIADGQTATFTFNIKVPLDMPSGKHRFYVRLVQDGYAWFENPDTNGAAWWEITVID